MHRRPSRQSRAHLVPSSSRELTIVDQAPSRQSALNDCLQMQKKLAELQHEILRFREHDEPRFRGWCLNIFGDELTQLRLLENVIQEKEQLLHEIMQLVLFSKMSPKRAYEQVMDEFHRRKQAAQEQDFQWGSNEDAQGEDESHGCDPNANDGNADSSDEDPHHESRESRESFSGASRGKSEKQDSGFLGRHGRQSAGNQSIKSSAEMEIKRLYRTLARVLHPDMNSELTVQQRRLWDEVQAAYEQSDVSKLKALAVVVQMSKGNVDSDLQISALWDAFHFMKKSCNSLLRQRASMKKDLAWSFDMKTATERQKLEKKMRIDLTLSVESAHEQLEKLNEALDDMSRDSSRRSGAQRHREAFFDDDSFY